MIFLPVFLSLSFLLEFFMCMKVSGVERKVESGLVRRKGVCEYLTLVRWELSKKRAHQTPFFFYSFLSPHSWHKSGKMFRGKRYCRSFVEAIRRNVLTAVQLFSHGSVLPDYLVSTSWILQKRLISALCVRRYFPGEFHLSFFFNLRNNSLLYLCTLHNYVLPNLSISIVTSTSQIINLNFMICW